MSRTASVCRRVRWALALVLALGTGVSGALAQSLGDEASAKAKLVTALIRFVQWPSATFEDGSPLRLCVYSQSKSIERAFLAYQDAAVGRRPLAMAFNPSGDGQGCHVLYVDDLSSVVGAARARTGGAIFTIGAADGFVANGGMVEVLRIESTMRFDVNLGAMREAGLSINPGVLKLARRVTQ